jgi:hypothetical protein
VLEDTVRTRAFATSLTSPAYLSAIASIWSSPSGPTRTKLREPRLEPLAVHELLVKFELIRMPDSARLQSGALQLRMLFSRDRQHSAGESRSMKPKASGRRYSIERRNRCLARPMQ